MHIAGTVRQVADRIAASPAQVALAWLLTQGQHVVPIPGTKTPAYLADNAGGADLMLSPEDLQALDAVPAPVGARY
jgi:aryl-alcohol dehydrogenase-like predicted oxidoreductase